MYLKAKEELKGVYPYLALRKLQPYLLSVEEKAGASEVKIAKLHKDNASQTFAVATAVLVFVSFLQEIGWTILKNSESY